MMKKLTRKNLDELAKMMPVISEIEQRRFVGGGNGSYESPYTVAEYDRMCDNGTWHGGYVQGWGYTYPDVTCISDGRIITSESGTFYRYMWSEGVGINGSFNYGCSTVVENGEIMISAGASNPYLGSNAEMSGNVSVYVDGRLVATSSLTLPPSSISSPDLTPLGFATFDLTQYHGHVEIVVGFGCTYDSGSGIGSTTASKVVYSQYR